MGLRGSQHTAAASRPVPRLSAPSAPDCASNPSFTLQDANKPFLGARNLNQQVSGTPVRDCWDSSSVSPGPSQWGGGAWGAQHGNRASSHCPRAACSHVSTCSACATGNPQHTAGNRKHSEQPGCHMLVYSGSVFPGRLGGSVPYTVWHTQRGWVWGFAFVPGAQLWEVGVAETSARVGQTVLVPSAGGAARGMGAVGQWVLRWQWGGMAPNWQLPVQPPQPGLGCAWKRWMRWSEQDGCPTPCRPLRAGCGVGLTLQWGNTRTAAVLQAALLAGWTVLVLQA